MPTISLADGGTRHCDQNVLRKLPVQKAAKLKAGRWILVYDKRNYDNANNVFNCLQKSAVSIGMVVEEPAWFEIGK